MGTFHDDKGELHGITVVVETTGPRTYIGRCFEETEQGIVLLDVDFHDPAEHDKTKDEYLQHAVKFGQWKKLAKFVVPNDEVAKVQRLAELAP